MSPGATIKSAPVGEAIGAIRAMQPSPVSWDKGLVQICVGLPLSVSPR